MISIRYSIYIYNMYTHIITHPYTYTTGSRTMVKSKKHQQFHRQDLGQRCVMPAAADWISSLVRPGNVLKKQWGIPVNPKFIYINSLDFTSLFCFIWVAILWYRQWFAIALNSCCWCWFRSMPVWMAFFGWSTGGCFAARVTIRSFCSTDHRAVARHWQLKPSLRCYACRFMCPRMPECRDVSRLGAVGAQ